MYKIVNTLYIYYIYIIIQKLNLEMLMNVDMGNMELGSTFSVCVIYF